MIKLNKELIKKQNLTKKDIANIKKLHVKKNKLFNNIKKWMNKNDLKKIKESAKLIEELEFKLQDAWKFERNSKMHTHWLYNPACTCPKLDNEERFYTGQRIYSKDCIVHGDTIEIKKEEVVKEKDLEISDKTKKINQKELEEKAEILSSKIIKAKSSREIDDLKLSEKIKKAKELLKS